MFTIIIILFASNIEVNLIGCAEPVRIDMEPMGGAELMRIEHTLILIFV